MTATPLVNFFQCKEYLTKRFLNFFIFVEVQIFQKIFLTKYEPKKYLRKLIILSSLQLVQISMAELSNYEAHNEDTQTSVTYILSQSSLYDDSLEETIKMKTLAVIFTLLLCYQGTVYIRTVTPYLFFNFGTFDSFLMGLGRY